MLYCTVAQPAKRPGPALLAHLQRLPRPQPRPGPANLSSARARLGLEPARLPPAVDLDRTVVLAFRANKTDTSGLPLKP